MDTQEEKEPVPEMPPDEPEIEVAKGESGSTGPKGLELLQLLDLKGKNLTHAQIGELLGCSHQNVSRRLRRFAPLYKRLDLYKKYRADLLTLTQSKILDAVTPEKIAKASLWQSAAALDILHKAERLERGQATVNIDLHAEIQQARERIRALRDLLGIEEAGGDDLPESDLPSNKDEAPPDSPAASPPGEGETSSPAGEASESPHDPPDPWPVGGEGEAGVEGSKVTSPLENFPTKSKEGL